MKKLQILFYTFTIISVFFATCNDKKSDKSVEQSTEQAPEVRPFSIENYNFAIKKNGKFIQYNKAIYQRGDEIFLVLKNVGSFARGTDSLNRAEMTVEVKDAVGQVISPKRKLFGNKGHADFKDNILKSPYAAYTSDSKDKPGKYSMYITIYDLVKNDSIVIEDDFYIE